MNLLESLFTMIGMIFIMGVFVSLVVGLGIMRAKEEAERRKAIREAQKQ